MVAALARAFGEPFRIAAAEQLVGLVLVVAVRKEGVDAVTESAPPVRCGAGAGFMGNKGGQGFP